MSAYAQWGRIFLHYVGWIRKRNGEIMQFTNRETEFPGLKRLIKVDGNNVPIPNEDAIFVNIENVDGTIHEPGTPIDVDALNRGNWRDNKSISFTKMYADDLPPVRENETQIVTKSNGETWIIPPSGTGHSAMMIADPIGTSIKINGQVQSEINFMDDPQRQILSALNMADTALRELGEALCSANSKSTVNVGGIKSNIDFTSEPQFQIDTKSTVNVGGIRADVNFVSDPQSQMNEKAEKTALNALSDRLVAHTTRIDNPHSLTKEQLGLDQVSNTSDLNKPLSTAQVNALGLKADATRLSGVTKWQLVYDAGSTSGIIARGSTSIFKNHIGKTSDTHIFRIHMRDNRTRGFNGSNTRFTQTGTIIFRNSEQAMWQYDSPFDGGVGFRIRTFFQLLASKEVHMFTQASQVASAGNTNWGGQDDNYYIVRIEKEVQV